MADSYNLKSSQSMSVSFDLQEQGDEWDMEIGLGGDHAASAKEALIV